MNVPEALAVLGITKQLPEVVAPAGAVVLLRALDEDGQMAWFRLVAPELNDIEVLGALEYLRVTVADHLLRADRPLKEDDDDAPQEP